MLTSDDIYFIIHKCFRFTCLCSTCTAVILIRLNKLYLMEQMETLKAVWWEKSKDPRLKGSVSRPSESKLEGKKYDDWALFSIHLKIKYLVSVFRILLLKLVTLRLTNIKMQKIFMLKHQRTREKFGYLSVTKIIANIYDMKENLI